MPMNMAVSPLATQRQDINPLRIDTFADGLRRSIDCALKGKIFIEAKITGDLLFMLDRSNQCIAIKSRIFVQEYDELIVLLNNMITVQTTGDHFTDKAGIALNPLNI